MIKRVLSVLMTTVLIVLIFPVIKVNAAGCYIRFTYSDMQAEKSDIDLSYGGNGATDSIWRQRLRTSDSSRGISCDGIFYLAQNEREGVQIFFYEGGVTDDSARNLRIEVSDFVNSDGNKLVPTLYREEYVTPLGDSLKINGVSQRLADPLVPYRGESVPTVIGENQMFYLEVRSSGDQPAGTYYATVTFSDDSGVFASRRIAAVVWGFKLPEQHYGSMTVGLYNSSSGYGATNGFLKLNGVRFDENGSVLPQDRDKADRIIEGWQEYLLDHGISTFEIPEGLIDRDPKSAQLSIADIRRKYFFVPLLNPDSYNGAYSQQTVSKINQFRNLVEGNDYLCSKAVLYTMDEVNPIDNAELIRDKLAAANSAWQDVKKLITYNGSGGNYEQALTVLNPTENIVCVNTATLNGSSYLKNEFLNNFSPKWRYPAEVASGGFELWRWKKSANGGYRRMVFWQQHNGNEDNVLYWNCAYYPDSFNVWENNTLPESGGIQTGNGNGILLYPGLPIGESPKTPIGSLRIKQIASGLDDEDYLYLADEFLSEDERPEWTAFADWNCSYLNEARIELGDKLEKVSQNHVFSAWETVVEPDYEHDGLEIRKCENCGTVESRKIPKPELVLGDVDNDGEVTVADATLIQKEIARLVEFDADVARAADVDYDEKITIIDVTRVQKYVAGLIDEF